MNRLEVQQDPSVPLCGREEGHGKRTVAGALSRLPGRKAVEGSVKLAPDQLQDGRWQPCVQKRAKEQIHFSVDGAVWRGWPRKLPPGKHGDAGCQRGVQQHTKGRDLNTITDRLIFQNLFLFSSRPSVGTELAPGIMFRQIQKKWQREWPAFSEPLVHFWCACMCARVSMCVLVCAPTLY